MKIIDRYIIRQFVNTFLFGLIVFALIFVVIDMIEKIDDFIDKDVPAEIILEYYLVFIPDMIKMIIPVSVLLAGLFTAGKMSTLNELTSIKAAGISFYRYIAPFMIVTLLISIAAVYFGGFVVPMANKQKVFIEQTYMKKGLENNNDDIYFQDSNTRIVTINYYNIKKNEATRIGIQDFDSSNSTKMTMRIDAAKMYYDTSSQAWQLVNVFKREFRGGIETAQEYDTLMVNDLNFKPLDVEKKQRKPSEMTLTELKQYAEEQRRAGNDPTRILIEYNTRYSFGFASFVVILFGLTISANKRKGGVALHFGINLAITFIYLVFFKVSEAFGKNGVLDPALTAWLANIIFITAGFINLIRIEK